MARSMTGAALTQSLVKTAQEPIIVAKIEWDSGTKYYCDKTYTFGVHACSPTILSFGSCKSSAPQSSIGSITTMELTLDDTDGTLKAITNTDWVEGTHVKIFHQFPGLADEDAVVLIDGKVVSDIVWHEGERTLTITIESDTTSKQFGFAAVSGDWPNLHEEAVGKPWPFCFGSPRMVPALRIYRPTRTVLAERIDATNGSYLVKDGYKFPQEVEVTIDIGGIYFTGIFSGNIFTPVTNGINVTIYEDLTVADREDEGGYVDPTIAWIEDSNGDPVPMVGRFIMAHHNFGSGDKELYNLCVDQQGKKCDFAVPMRTWMPEDGGEIALTASDSIEEVRGWPHDSWINEFAVAIEHKVKADGGVVDTTHYYPIESIDPDGWKRDAGTRVLEITNHGDLYVCNADSSSAIHEVWGMRKVSRYSWSHIIGEGIEIKEGLTVCKIPYTYYTKRLAHDLGGSVILDGDGNELTPTTLEFTTALEDYVGEGWTGEIFTSVTSTICSNSQNTANVIKHILEYWTNLTVDASSFASVANDINTFRSDFCFRELEDALTLCNRMAWEARCGLYVSNRIVYIKYLSEEPSATFVASEGNTAFKSLSASFMPIEDLKTCIKAQCNYTYFPEDSKELFKYKNNEGIYGLMQMEHDFLIYTNPDCMKVSAAFWGYRYSNSWRILNTSHFLSALILEPRDCVKYNLEEYTNISLKGIITDLVHDTTEHSIILSTLLASKTGDTGTFSEPNEDPEFWSGPDPWEADAGYSIPNPSTSWSESTEYVLKDIKDDFFNIERTKSDSIAGKGPSEKGVVVHKIDDITKKRSLEEVEPIPKSLGDAVWNESGEAIPAYSAMEVYGKTALQQWKIRKPTEDSLPVGLVLFNGEATIADDASGIGYSAFDDDVIVEHDGDAPDIGDIVGTQENDYDIAIDKTGFIVLDATSGRVVLRPKSPFNNIATIDGVYMVDSDGGDAEQFTADIFSTGTGSIVIPDALTNQQLYLHFSEPIIWGEDSRIIISGHFAWDAFIEFAAGARCVSFLDYVTGDFSDSITWESRPATSTGVEHYIEARSLNSYYFTTNFDALGAKNFDQMWQIDATTISDGVVVYGVRVRIQKWDIESETGASGTIGDGGNYYTARALLTVYDNETSFAVH